MKAKPKTYPDGKIFLFSYSGFRIISYFGKKAYFFLPLLQQEFSSMITSKTFGVKDISVPRDTFPKFPWSEQRMEASKWLQRQHHIRLGTQNHVTVDLINKDKGSLTGSLPNAGGRPAFYSVGNQNMFRKLQKPLTKSKQRKIFLLLFFKQTSFACWEALAILITLLILKGSAGSNEDRYAALFTSVSCD